MDDVLAVLGPPTIGVNDTSTSLIQVSVRPFAQKEFSTKTLKCEKEIRIENEESKIQ